MPTYFLHFFEGSKLARCERFRSADDSTAIEEATRMRGTEAAELWRGNLKLRYFNETVE